MGVLVDWRMSRMASMFSGRDRLFQPQQLEGFELDGHALARGGIVAAVHIDGQIHALVHGAAHEGDLFHHAVDLGVVGRPVDPVEAVGVAGLIDVDLERGEAHGLDLLELLRGEGIVGVVVGRVAIDAHAVAHLAAEELIDGDAERLAGQVPERNFDGGEGRDILPALGPGENAVETDAFPQRLDVQRVASDEGVAEGAHQGHAAHNGVGGFTVPEDALVGVDADVELIAVAHHLGRAHVGDLEFRPAVGRGLRLQRGGQRRQGQGCGAQKAAAGLWHVPMITGIHHLKVWNVSI